jgi:hypothetical protein
MNALKPFIVKNKNITKNHEHGQAIILIVFAMIGIISMVALAVDGGRAFLEKRNVQTAVDAVALGSALARIRDPQGEWVDQAYAIAEINGYNNNGLNNSVAIYSPPLTGKYTDDIEYIQVIITSFIPTYFGNVIGIKRLRATAEAISRTQDGEIGPILDGNAVVSLAPKSDCQDNRSFWIQGESTLNITGGGILINSSNPDCAMMQNGSASIRIEDGEIKVVGGIDVQKPQLITPFPTNTGPGHAISYPPPFLMPEFGCRKIAEIQPDKVTISSGAWDGSQGTFPPPGIQFLESGVYCLDTDFIARNNEPLQGNNVLFKVEGGEIRFGGETEVNLSAPTSGEFAGLLIYAPIQNHNRIILNGGANTSIRGTILAPGADIHINGNASKYGFHSQIIGYTIQSNGTDNIRITYKDEDNYDAYNAPQIYLIK